MTINFRHLIVSSIAFSLFAVLLAQKSGLNISFFDDGILLASLLLFVYASRLKCWQTPMQIVGAFAMSLTFSALINRVELLTYILSLRSYLLPIVAYVVFASMCRWRSTIRTLERFLIGVSVPLGVVGIVEYTSGTHFINALNKFGEVSEGPFRVHSLIGNPIDYGFFLLFPIFLQIGRLYHCRVRTEILWSFTFLTILVVNLLLTMSRGPIITFFVVALVVYARSLLRGAGVRTLFLMVPIIIAVSYSGWTIVEGRFSQSEPTLPATSVATNEEASRLFFYAQSLDVILDNPVFGVGPGRYGGWVSIQTESPVYERYDVSTLGISSIDLFLPHIVGELGLVGAGLYYLVFYSMFLRYRRFGLIARAQSDHRAEAWLSFARAAIIIIVISSFITMIPETFMHMITFWSIIGASEALIRARLRYGRT